MSKVIPVNLSEVMPTCYIDYAIDVIGDRALPDIRDGLKPVHRRILHDLNELKVVPEKGYRKSARIVGDVLGKYHPHGDQSVYDAMVRLAQPWSMRYMLVDGHGNFGSIDGDSPASMRYTEVRQQKIMQEMVKDINKNTVDFVPNFDGEEKEPSVLPSRFPNLLVNGSYGIAVGFATNLAPHNLGEVVDGIIYQIDNPDCTTKELMQFIKAPDFPTGTNIINPEDLEQIYTSGHGKIITRATYHLENIQLDLKGNKQRECIVFTDVPYQVTKTRLITTIDEKIHDTKKIVKGKEQIIKAVIPEIESILDESDRNGIRIVVTPRKQANIQTILHKLYKYTPIQNNFNINNTVLIDNFPCENVPLKVLITHYILHQQDVLKRRTTFDKIQAEKSLHILLGTQKAIDKLDLTIKTIKESSNKKEAKENLIDVLQIDEFQAESILQIQLQRLTNLEKENIISQIGKLQALIKKYTTILDDPQELNEVLKTELLEIKEKYNDERRTKIIYNAITDIDTDLLVEQYSTTIQLTNEGYIKKIRATSVRGKTKDKLKEGDYITKEINGDNRDTIILFSNKGNGYKIKANELKEVKCSELGQIISNLIELEDNEYIINIISTSFSTNESLIEIFANGSIARIGIESYNKSIKKLNKCYTEVPIDIQLITNDVDVLLVSQEGKALIINTSQLRPTKSRNTQGVVGMKIDPEDNKVIGSIIGVTVDHNFNIETEKGKSKFIMLNDIAPNGKESMTEYLKGNRNTQGNFIYNTRQKNDKVIKLTQPEN